MAQHHPSAQNNPDFAELTIHLLSTHNDQFLRTIHHPFLARAANGTLPKPLVAQWLANDLQYLKVYKGVSEQTLAVVHRESSPGDVEMQLTAWLEAAVLNGAREENLFQEVASKYQFDISITEATKNQGLRRYEAMYNAFINGDRNAFLPWLEGAVILWAMERVYYEAWNWSSKQDAQPSPKSYENDQDDGAMRKEFIPNWSNREFLTFVEQLERAVNEGVSEKVKGDGEAWKQVKDRAEAVWKEVLDAEEVFWPDVDRTVDEKEDKES